MKNKLKVFIVCIFAFAMFFQTNIYAASVNISANTSVEIGNNVTINISVPGVSGKCNVTSSNPGVVSLSTGTIWVEMGATSPIVGYTKGAGTATITVTPDTMADDITGDDVSVAAKSITITVKEKYVPPVNNNTNNNNNTNTNTNTNNNAGATNNTSNNNAAAKSSNAYLSKLQVNVEGLTPNFNKNKYSYTLSIGENVDSINVTAVAEDSSAKVAVYGNSGLKEGDNTISVVVTAANGSKKTYTIIATKSADPMKSNSYLSNLIIEDCVLTPEFSSEVFEYDLGTTSLDKLNIFAYPTNESAKVEIIGNEQLVDGENIVKLVITSVDGTTTKEYILKVKKDTSAISDTVEVNALIDEGKLAKVSKWQELKQELAENWLVVLLFAFVLVEFIQILYLYCRLYNVKVTLPWKKYNDEKEEKNKESWFKKLNKDNEDFIETEIEDKIEKVDEAFDKVEEEVFEEVENVEESAEETVEETIDVNNEESANFDEDNTVLESDYESSTFESRVDEILENISLDENDDQTTEKRTRNGRK